MASGGQVRGGGEGGGGGGRTITDHSMEWTHVTDQKLPASAITAITESLTNVKDKWKEVGKSLNVTDLEKVEKSFEGSHEKCLKKVIEIWLENSPHPSWRQLAAAVARVNGSVAASIAAKHPSGSSEVPDLNDLMNAIAVKIPYKWQLVGGELGFSGGELEGIKMQNEAQDLHECFRDLFVKWKSKADDEHPYRLSTILAALQSTQVDEKEVAINYHRELQKVHKLNDRYPNRATQIQAGDHSKLMNKIGAPAKDMWRAIGSELRLSVSELNSIRVRQANNPINCISKVFDRWRSGLTREPITWQTVLVALCKPQVGLKECADKVDKELS